MFSFVRKIERFIIIKSKLLFLQRRIKKYSYGFAIINVLVASAILSILILAVSNVIVTTLKSSNMSKSISDWNTMLGNLNMVLSDKENCQYAFWDDTNVSKFYYNLKPSSKPKKIKWKNEEFIYIGKKIGDYRIDKIEITNKSVKPKKIIDPNNPKKIRNLYAAKLLISVKREEESFGVPSRRTEYFLNVITNNHTQESIITCYAGFSMDVINLKKSICNEIVGEDAFDDKTGRCSSEKLFQNILIGSGQKSSDKSNINGQQNISSQEKEILQNTQEILNNNNIDVTNPKEQESQFQDLISILNNMIK